MNNTFSNKITQGVIWKQLLIFFFPIVLGTFFQQLYNTVDAVVVGNYVNITALAAVGGSTSTLITLIVGFFVGLSTGATVIISQYLGAYDANKVRKAVHTSMALGIVGGFILMIFGLIISPYALEMMNTHVDIMPYATTYLQIYFLGMIFNMIYNIGSGILWAAGDSKRPLYFLIAGCITNIILDYVFVIFLNMEVAGVALATIISQLVSAALVVYTLFNNDQLYRLEFKAIRFDAPILRQIILIGLPAGIQSVMYALSNVIIQTSINSYDTSYVAAYTAYSKIDGFFWLVIGAFGLAITTFVGQNFGAGKYDRMKKSVTICIGMALLSTVVIIILFNLFGETIYLLFTKDYDVILKGMEMLRFLTPFFVAFVFIEVLSGALRGTGDTLIPTIITALGVCGIRIVWILFLVPADATLNYVLICYPLSWCITAGIFMIYYYQGGWLKRRIRKIA